MTFLIQNNFYSDTAYAVLFSHIHMIYIYNLCIYITYVCACIYMHIYTYIYINQGLDGSGMELLSLEGFFLVLKTISLFPYLQER